MRRQLLFVLAPLAVACGPADPCSDTSGDICTWLGVPETAMFSEEGAFRLEANTYLPQDGIFDSLGRFVFIDFNNHRIRRIDEEGFVTTIAGSGMLGDGVAGSEGLPLPEGPATDFAFNHPTDLAFDPVDDNILFVAAWHNSRIVRVDLPNNLARTECATGARDFGGDGGPAAAAFLDLPSSLAFDADRTMYIMDQANQVVRRISPEGVIDTCAGIVEERTIGTKPDGSPLTDIKGWPGYEGDGGPKELARFHATVGQAADPSSRIALANGKLFIADTENHLIRAIDLETGLVDRVVGKVETRTGDFDGNPTTAETTETRGFPGYSGDGGPATEAALAGPRDLEVLPDGTIYIADTLNHCIRKVDPAGIISTVAGVCGQQGFAGDNGPASEALLDKPYGIEIAPDGALIIADTGNQVFRRVVP